MVRPSASHEPDSRSRAGLLSLHEVADRLEVHYMTAYRYVRTGRLRAVQIGSQWWVDPRDLAEAADGQAVAGRPRAVTRRSSRLAAAKRLEGRLVAGDEPGAWAIIEGRLGAGTSPDEVLLDELGVAMRSVGDGWEAGDYTVDDEHRATGVATRIVGRLGARFTKRGPNRRSIILGTPPHELHGLPTAMAANILRGHGYDVMDLGADVPADAFGAAVTKTPRPLAVAVAVTSGNHDRSLRAIVRAVQSASPGLPVVVGGGGIAGEQHAAPLAVVWSGGDARRLAAVIEDLDRRPG
jgi:MerR family transcriptional regulator, light-induced transcriptional regulator